MSQPLAERMRPKTLDACVLLKVVTYCSYFITLTKINNSIHFGKLE